MESENRLLQLMSENQEVLGKILATDNKDDALAVAQGVISDYSKDDFAADLQGIKEIIYGPEYAQEELDIDDLDTVTGGGANPTLPANVDPDALSDWLNNIS